MKKGVRRVWRVVVAEERRESVGRCDVGRLVSVLVLGDGYESEL